MFQCFQSERKQEHTQNAHLTTTNTMRDNTRWPQSLVHRRMPLRRRLLDLGPGHDTSVDIFGLRIGLVFCGGVGVDFGKLPVPRLTVKSR